MSVADASEFGRGLSAEFCCRRLYDQSVEPGGKVAVDIGLYPPIAQECRTTVIGAISLDQNEFLLLGVARTSP